MNPSQDPLARAAVDAAIRWHETDGLLRVAERLSFANRGGADDRSGGSFGYYQHDCSADPHALSSLCVGLAASDTALAARVRPPLSRPSVGSPLAPADLTAIDAYLASTAGVAMWSALDAAALDGLMAGLDRAAAAAARNGSTMDVAALVGVAMWANQSGPESVILTYLAGGAVRLSGRTVPPLPRGAPIGEAEFMAYYDRLGFVVANPGQEPRMLQAIRVGVAAATQQTRAVATASRNTVELRAVATAPETEE